VPLEEENFGEALKAAFHVWTRPGVPPEVAALLASEAAAAPIDAATPDFWVLAAALKAFVEQARARAASVQPPWHRAACCLVCAGRRSKRRPRSTHPPLSALRPPPPPLPPPRQEGGLPLEGSIPDMHATTETYLALARLYRERAGA